MAEKCRVLFHCYSSYSIKGKACLENNIDIFVDDSLKHLNRIYDAGIKKIYIFDNVYNRENNKYNRIYSFRDLYYNVIG